ncbi:hypothetical protein FKW77_007053 [Venturia effusa]|uniref:FAD-binding domain-containing protein n=1 Tax=Venturia effusa TaxID=50376 RepID=A0A517LKG2_9PEZI|nr:hypothetical protein FKW77_007053 [Venturia effusa]
MSQQPITIIGAGIGGRVLGQALKRKNIPATIYEKSPAPRYSYGITIQAPVWRRLRQLLQADDIAFRGRITVDAPEGFGLVSIHRATDFAVRVHRQKFEELLGEGLDIRYDHELKSIDTSQSLPEIMFANGQKVSGSAVVAFDGVHSPIRKALLPDIKPKVLPYVVINGKRRVEKATYDKLYDPAILRGNLISTRRGDTALQISVNESKRADLVSISFVYSRPARTGNGDPLYNPTRSTNEAKTIPEAFFEEIATMTDLDQPYADVFDVDTLKENKTLISWLMRTVSPPIDELKELGKKGVLFAGDAVHAHPIIGGNGANEAITDGIDLAEVLSEKVVSSETLNSFYEKKGLSWDQHVSDSEENIEKMHTGRSAL